MSDQVQPTGYQPTAAERATATQRRGQAFIGAAAGLVVIAVIVGVFIWVANSGDGTPTAAPAPVSSAAASGGPQQPAQPEPATEAPSAAVPPAGVDPALSVKPVVKAGTGALTKLVITPIIEGDGPTVASGQTLTCNYVGVLFKDGEEFDASWKTGQPAQFPIGVGKVIRGWDQGLVGLKVGSRVQLDIPADLAYGDPAPAGYPQGALRFVVDILGAQ